LRVMRRAVRIAAALGVVILATACSSVKIQTGPASEEEATESSELRGKGLRAEYKNRLDQAGPLEKVQLWTGFVDSVMVWYLRTGSNIADQWRQGSEGRGQEVPVAEMRQVVSNSIASDLPLLESYDDIVEYGLAEIQRTDFVDNTTDSLLKELRDHYYDVYSYVFLPNGTRFEYEHGLEDLRLSTEELAGQVDRDIRRYQ
jgi:hypothetical protein